MISCDYTPRDIRRMIGGESAEQIRSEKYGEARAMTDFNPEHDLACRSAYRLWRFLCLRASQEIVERERALLNRWLELKREDPETYAEKCALCRRDNRLDTNEDDPPTTDTETRQLCVVCGKPTGRNAEDSLYYENSLYFGDDKIGPLCDNCYDEYIMEE